MREIRLRGTLARMPREYNESRANLSSNHMPRSTMCRVPIELVGTDAVLENDAKIRTQLAARRPAMSRLAASYRTSGCAE